MRFSPLIVITIISIYGCRVEQTRPGEVQQNISAIVASEQKATLRYMNASLCSKAFAATKVFVMEKSDMRVNLSDDTLVATYGPTGYFKIGMTASKKPDAGDGCTISLNTRCRGEEDIKDSGTMTMCRIKIVEINEQFRPYVEKSIGAKSM